VQQNRAGEQKLFNLFGLFSLFLLFANILFAGSFENFKELQSESFLHYKDEKDNAFNAYLKAQWQEYQAYISPSFYHKQKPEYLLSLHQKQIPSVGPIVKILQQKKKRAIQKETYENNVSKGITFTFFGTRVGFIKDKTIQNAKYYPQNQAGIANFFSILAASDYDKTINQLKHYKKNLHLNDWALYLLVHELTEKNFNDRNEANIYAWFLLSKLHFDVKIALNERKNIYLLYYTQNTIYAAPRYNFSSKNYYILSKYNLQDIKKIYTYTQTYPQSTKPLDFSLMTLPKFNDEFVFKRRTFKEFGKNYIFSYKYNKNITDFMRTYPQIDYDVYFKAPMEDITYEALVESIKKYTDGKKMSEALNIVLHFVQKAFKYETDQDQFGHEKIMFAAETLAYDASDCEDRAILFAYLVKHIFGISVVGVKYSDHMSTALYIPMQGDSLIVNRRRYVVADPTYINANIGQRIPKYRNIRPDAFIYMDSSH